MGSGPIPGCHEIWNIFRIEAIVRVFMNQLRVPCMCPSQRLRCLKHKLPSPVRMLASWVGIPLEAWMSVCVYSVCVVLCVGRGFATGWCMVKRVLLTVNRVGKMVNLFLCSIMHYACWNWCIDSSFLDLSISWKYVVRYLQATGALHPGKCPRYPLDRGPSGPQIRSGRYG
jgi:hypothetical protein